MTKEKAIPVLETIKHRTGDMSGFDPDAGYEAISVATRSLQAWEKIKTQIREEIEQAYADFEQYKMDYLGCEDVDDDPLDFFHCGLERTIEIINKHLSEVEGQGMSFEDCISRRDATSIASIATASVQDVVFQLKMLPSVQPTKAKGRWVYDASIDHTNGHCNKCGHYMRYGEKTNFCPDCGAEMEVDD